MNWSTYIWAINSGRVIQTSIGYYIEPIVICLVGIVVFGEKLTRYNLTAIILAAAAVMLILVHFGQLPGVALALAGTWAVYSAIKKTAEQPAIIALVYETMIYAVLSVFAIIYIESKGIGALSVATPGKYVLLLLSGLMTLIPVGLFGAAAKKVPLLIVGLAQYISPTITLICGIFLFKEDVDMVQIIAFVIIWTGLVFFTCGEFAEARAEHTEN